MGFALGPGCTCCAACERVMPRDYCKYFLVTVSGIGGASCCQRMNGVHTMLPQGMTTPRTYIRTFTGQSLPGGYTCDDPCFAVNTATTFFNSGWGIRASTKTVSGQEVIDWIEIRNSAYGPTPDAVNTALGYLKISCDEGEWIITDRRPGTESAIRNCRFTNALASGEFVDAGTDCLAGGLDDAPLAPDYDLTTAQILVDVPHSLSGTPDYYGTYRLNFIAYVNGFAFFSGLIDTVDPPPPPDMVCNLMVSERLYSAYETFNNQCAGPNTSDKSVGAIYVGPTQTSSFPGGFINANNQFKGTSAVPWGSGGYYAYPSFV